jgi:hypothetical protein
MDKERQNQILQFLKEHYPNDVYFPEHSIFKGFLQTKDFQANLYYLAEHNLIDLKYIRRGIVNSNPAYGAKMTAKGMDYISPDGGLTEYFNSINVKFDAENIRQAIFDHIDSLEIDTEKKKGILSNLKNFSVDTLREIAQQAILKGLENPQFLSQLIENWHCAGIGG